MEKIYYSPKGYWKGISAIKKLAKEAKVSQREAREWLKKQAIWQIYLPAPKTIVRPKFDVSSPNEVHQADLLFLPHDTIGKKKYKYALTIIDIASRYKEAEPLTTKDSKHVALAFEKIYKRSPLKYPNLLQVDPGTEFMGSVSQLMAKHKVNIRRGRKEIHRDQGLVERFNRTLAERLFGHQYAEEMKNPHLRSREWVRRLPEVISALNNEVTRLIKKKPSDAIKLKSVYSKDVKVKKGPAICPNANIRYLYQPGELEGGERRRATDPIWSVDIQKISHKVGDVYYLRDPAPTRGFLREELLIVPADTQTHR